MGGCLKFKGRYVKGKGGVRVFCRYLKKKGPWLLFLHGGGGSLSAWFMQERFFANREYSLLFIDLRGHGKSDRGKTDEFFSLDNFTEDVALVLKQLKIRKATVIGHCFGAVVAQQFCADYPHRVSQLVLINSGKGPFRNPRRMVVRAFCHVVRYLPFSGRIGHANYAKHVGRVDVSLIRFLDDIWYSGRRTAAHTYRMTSEFKSSLKGFPKPVLLIHGTKDTITPHHHSLEMHHALPNSRIVLLDTNHIAIYNSPESVNHALLGFVRNNPV